GVQRPPARRAPSPSSAAKGARVSRQTITQRYHARSVSAPLSHTRGCGFSQSARETGDTRCAGTGRHPLPYPSLSTRIGRVCVREDVEMNAVVDTGSVVSPMVLVDLEQGSPEWLAWRAEGIGASDAATIMGENPYQTP